MIAIELKSQEDEEKKGHQLHCDTYNYIRQHTKLWKEILDMK